MNGWVHWTHDEVFKEILKASIPTLGTILSILVTWYKARKIDKVAQETREATPPELLRLEKWSTILKESEQYPGELKNELEIVEEKLRDAESSGDRKAKYNLIRIRQKMKSEIERIRYSWARDEARDIDQDSGNDD